ncbi:MAG: presenilin family intramembrane aspartyl protease [archaeon]
MKHTWSITLLLLAMFFVTQFLGLFVVNQYSPQDQTLPYGMEPPEDVEPQSALDLVISFAIAFAFVVILMLILTKYNAETFLRIWFFVVVALAIGISLNSVLFKIPYASVIAMAIALPLAFYKIFKRNLIVHNITELFVYPGIAAIFVVMLTSWTSSPFVAIIIILILISIYDMYAVWHAGFMQKMAKYQIQTLKVFTGFFVPYIGKKEKRIIAKSAKTKSKNKSPKKVNVGVAILGGGDVVFPIILAGITLIQIGLISALMVSVGATIALALLFYLSEKGKFYPAMPFITTGCFIALGLARLIF